MVEEELHELIRGCIEQDRRCQKLLYKTFYSFAIGICMRYTGNRDAAAEVMNQGFLKVFNRLDTYKMEIPFKAWLGKIMVNVSIDFYRANLKTAYMDELDQANDISDGELTDKNLNYNDLLLMIQQLPGAYRTVFNLFAIEGYSHNEIAEMLKINSGTSKSNLHKARQRLKQMIFRADSSANTGNYNNGINNTSQMTINTIDINGVLLNRGIKE